MFSVLRKDGELPVLPLSVYGAVAMAHNEASEEYSSPYQFFFYLYDKRSVSAIYHYYLHRVFIRSQFAWTYKKQTIETRKQNFLFLGVTCFLKLINSFIFPPI